MNRLLRFRLVVIVIFVGLLRFSSVAQQIIVRPFIQPGNAPGLSKEEKVLIWQAVGVEGDFEVTYTGGRSFESQSKVREAKVTNDIVNMGGIITRVYRARLNRLELDSAFVYDVKLGGKSIASEWFYTRSTKDDARFAVMGDCCTGTKEQAAIANSIYQLKPQFVMIIGDVVYQHGLMREYLRNYFPYYAAREADPQSGAPLIGSIPFYNVIGNHDVLADDLEKYPDGLGYFYYHDLPLNAPTGQFYLKLEGNSDAVKDFKSNNRSRYPSMTNYSFVNGNVHMIVLDSNPYTTPLDPVILPWMVNELKNSRSEWKIVAFHHPGFNSNSAHNDDQYMRLLSPVMEQLGVDLVLSGHVHNYQRTLPLLFEPEKDESGSKYIISPEGNINGKFTLDTEFDGVKHTKAKGIIYIISGAGGAPLYDDGLTDKPEQWLNGPKSKHPFTVQMVSNKHSFTFIETQGKELVLKQIDKDGNVFDEIKVTK